MLIATDVKNHDGERCNSAHGVQGGITFLIRDVHFVQAKPWGTLFYNESHGQMAEFAGCQPALSLYSTTAMKFFGAIDGTLAVRRNASEFPNSIGFYFSARNTAKCCDSAMDFHPAG
jgi:hypothetical protein